ASERTKEIGTLVALGAPRSLVRRLFVVESLMVGALASIAGAVLGALACFVAGRIGIPFKPPNQPVVLVRPIATMGTAALGARVALAVAIIGSVLPAWIAARKHPLEAIGRSLN